MATKQATNGIPRLTLMEDFRTLLRKRMDERQLSVAELARNADVGRPYLHRVLSGQQIPTVDWMEKVGKQVGINVKLTVK